MKAEGRPRWFSTLAAAALTTLAVCWPAWPGFMSYDSLYAYEQGRFGIVSMTWPPLHAYLFRLTDALGLGVGALFAAQVFLLFVSAGLVFDLLVSRFAAAKIAFAGFFLSFIYFPAQLGVAQTHWRDVPTATFGLMAVALWLLAHRNRSRLLLLGAILSAFATVALRYNAFVLVAPFLLLVLWRPFGGPVLRRVEPGGRIVAAGAMVLGLGLATASTHWRLPDLKALPTTEGFVGTQLFDLIGVSACADRNFVPLAVSSDEPLTPYQIRQHYDPRHLLNTLRDQPGAPKLRETDGGGEVARQWREVVPRQWRCYLAHRSLVMVEQMGMAKDGLFYATHGGIDDNRFSLKLARPEAALAVSAYVERNAGELWRRPFILYLLMAAALAVAAVRRLPATPLLIAMGLGVAGYPALLFIAAPAADPRYIFPSNVFCQVIIAAVGMITLMPSKARGR